MSQTLSYDYSYGALKHSKLVEERYETSKKLSNVLKQFQELRDDIFNLRYEAEQINLEMAAGSDLAEFKLILPVIIKLSDAAEFISREELAEWKRERQNN